MRSRLDDLTESAAILREILGEIMRYDPRGILLIASNPVDILTYAAWKWSGLSSARVIGSGTSLDTSRFRRRVGERSGVAPENVHAYIIGEHGDSQVPVLSSAQIAGVHPQESCLKALASETRTAGQKIQRAKGATYYGIAAALTRITSAILRNENAVLTVSSLTPQSMGLGSVCLSLPSVINREGVARVLPISLSEAERRALGVSAEVLKRHIASLEALEETAA
jgi:L-lactate dehydrogenase